MTAPMFVATRDTLRDAVVGGRVVLDGAEGRHAAVVRRLRPGERVDLTDGAGRVAECVVAEALSAALVCDVRARSDLAVPRPRMVVVQALAKGSRGELAVELLTEVGADVIVPWAAARSVTRWREDRAAKGLARWRVTAREAAKQARRAWHPTVREPATTAEVARLLAAAALPLVLHEDADAPLAARPVPATGDVAVVVGPEGGLTDEELATFTQAGAAPVRLGPTVLRTSTAGVAAVAALLARTPRWG